MGPRCRGLANEHTRTLAHERVSGEVRGHDAGGGAQPGVWVGALVCS